MSTDTSIQPFVFRDPRECFVPNDVANALGMPSHIRQASLIVFSKNAKTAWARLKTLGLVHQKAHRLTEAHDVRSQAFADLTAVVGEGTVFMYPRDGGRVPVAEITSSDVNEEQRVVTLFGYLRPKLWINKESSLLREYVWEPIDGVTDGMLQAAAAELSTHEELTLDHVRRALRAALDVRSTEFGIEENE